MVYPCSTPTNWMEERVRLPSAAVRQGARKNGSNYLAKDRKAGNRLGRAPSRRAFRTQRRPWTC
jgi:hypothetical protein